MNETRQEDGVMSTLGPVIGFAVGALIGGGIALLLAPASGERTRRRISTSARRMGRDARQSIGDARDTMMDAATGLQEDVKSAIEAGRDAFRHDGQPHEGHVASRIGKAVNPSHRRNP